MRPPQIPRLFTSFYVRLAYASHMRGPDPPSLYVFFRETPPRAHTHMRRICESRAARAPQGSARTPGRAHTHMRRICEPMVARPIRTNGDSHMRRICVAYASLHLFSVCITTRICDAYATPECGQYAAKQHKLSQKPCKKIGIGYLFILLYVGPPGQGGCSKCWIDSHSLIQ